MRSSEIVQRLTVEWIGICNRVVLIPKSLLKCLQKAEKEEIIHYPYPHDLKTKQNKIVNVLENCLPFFFFVYM